MRAVDSLSWTFLVFSLTTAIACSHPQPQDRNSSDQSAPPQSQVQPAPIKIVEDKTDVPTPEPTEIASDSSPPKVDPFALLTPEQEQLFRSGEEDDFIQTSIHYVKSNEIRHDVYFPYIHQLGGVYVGVGSDQNYTIMAKAKAQLAFLLDIDRRVVDLHRIYEILIEASPTPESLVAHFHKDQEKTSRELLAQALADADEQERKRIDLSYRTSRETVYRHLLLVLKRTRDGASTSWLSDPELYDHIRKLYLANRIRPMAGDLAGPKSLQTVASVASQFGLPIQVVYLSNAEEYFKYTPQFSKNIQSLKGEENSVVLRTIYSKEWVHADALWAYQVQPLADFQTRLQDAKNRSRNPMFRYAADDGTLDKETGVKGFSLLGKVTQTIAKD